MGIQGYTTFLKKINYFGVNCELSFFNCIVIDICLYAYQFAHHHRNGYYIREEAWINAILDWLHNVRRQTKVIIVFDGKRRLEKKNKTKNIYRVNSKNFEHLKQAIKACTIEVKSPVYMTEEEYTETFQRSPFKKIKYNNDKMLTYVLRTEPKYDVRIAEYDGEQYCAELVRKGDADAVLTDDSDVLAWRADRWLKKKREKGKVVYTLYNYNDILKKAGLDAFQHTCMCIGAGCDYSNNVPGEGIITVYNKIKKQSFKLDKIKYYKYAFSVFNE